MYCPVRTRLEILMRTMQRGVCQLWTFARANTVELLFSRRVQLRHRSVLNLEFPYDEKQPWLIKILGRSDYTDWNSVRGGAISVSS
jgi:hypothetical protein